MILNWEKHTHDVQRIDTSPVVQWTCERKGLRFLVCNIGSDSLSAVNIWHWNHSWQNTSATVRWWQGTVTTKLWQHGVQQVAEVKVEMTTTVHVTRTCIPHASGNTAHGQIRRKTRRPAMNVNEWIPIKVTACPLRTNKSILQISSQTDTVMDQYIYSLLQSSILIILFVYQLWR